MFIEKLKDEEKFEIKLMHVPDWIDLYRKHLSPEDGAFAERCFLAWLEVHYTDDPESFEDYEGEASPALKKAIAKFCTLAERGGLWSKSNAVVATHSQSPSNLPLGTMSGTDLIESIEEIESIEQNISKYNTNIRRTGFSEKNPVTSGATHLFWVDPKQQQDEFLASPKQEDSRLAPKPKEGVGGEIFAPDLPQETAGRPHPFCSHVSALTMPTGGHPVESGYQRRIHDTIRLDVFDNRRQDNKPKEGMGRFGVNIYLDGSAVPNASSQLKLVSSFREAVQRHSHKADYTSNEISWWLHFADEIKSYNKKQDRTTMLVGFVYKHLTDGDAEKGIGATTSTRFRARARSVLLMTTDKNVPRGCLPSDIVLIYQGAYYDFTTMRALPRSGNRIGYAYWNLLSLDFKEDIQDGDM